MAEEIRSWSVRVEVDTNKRTQMLEIDQDDYSLDEVPSVIHEFLAEAAS